MIDPSLMKRLYGYCDICKKYGRVFNVFKQWHGEVKSMGLCSECKKEHEKDLEMCRKNFQRQFGDR